MRVGDMAAQVAQQLQEDHMAAIEAQGAPAVDLETPMVRDERKNIFSKIEFRWRRDDAKILEQIEAAVDVLYREKFAEAIAIMDEFYSAMKVPLGIGDDGRVQYETDSRGREIEDWSQLTGQDIEKAILDITRLKLVLAPVLNDLLLEAVFAKHIADDATHDAYSKLLEGTVKDREAYASREARQDKYQAYFRYYLYSHAEVFSKELNNFARVLERIRYWRIDEGGSQAP